jgi:hypothetical protein
MGSYADQAPLHLSQCAWHVLRPSKLQALLLDQLRLKEAAKIICATGPDCLAHLKTTLVRRFQNHSDGQKTCPRHVQAG